MKKILVSLSLCALVAFGSTSCKKDIEQNKGGHQFLAAMENCSSSDSKTTLSGSNINWNAGDEVMVYGTEQAGLYTAQPGVPATTATLVNVDMPAHGIPYTAIYPAALANSASNITLPALQETEDGNLMSNFPMIATSTDENLAFKNLCGALKVHLEQENVSIYKIEVTAETAINGTFDIDNSGDDPVLTNGTEGTTTTTLICTTPQDITGGHDFFVTMPAGDYQNLQVTIYRYDNAKRVKTAPAGATITIERSHYFTLNIATDFAPDPFVDGLISVSNTKQIYFAKGNLLFDNETGDWRFADNQYAHYNNHSNTGLRDEFYYSTPTSNFGLTRDMSDTNFVDWGAAINDDQDENPWYVLSYDEIDFMICNTVKRGNTKHGFASIAGNNGLVIVPDVWTCPEGVSFVPRGSGNPSFSSNTYTVEEWAKMEASGAAFLPIGVGASTQGYYWTVSRIGERFQSWRFKASNASMSSSSSWQDNQPIGVRLVMTARETNE